MCEKNENGIFEDVENAMRSSLKLCPLEGWITLTSFGPPGFTSRITADFLPDGMNKILITLRKCSEQVGFNIIYPNVKYKYLLQINIVKELLALTLKCN